MILKIESIEKELKQVNFQLINLNIIFQTKNNIQRLTYKQ